MTKTWLVAGLVLAASPLRAQGWVVDSMPVLGHEADRVVKTVADSAELAIRCVNGKQPVVFITLGYLIERPRGLPRFVTQMDREPVDSLRWMVVQYRIVVGPMDRKKEFLAQMLTHDTLAMQVGSRILRWSLAGLREVYPICGSPR